MTEALVPYNVFPDIDSFNGLDEPNGLWEKVRNDLFVRISMVFNGCGYAIQLPMSVRCLPGAPGGAQGHGSDAEAMPP